MNKLPITDEFIDKKSSRYQKSKIESTVAQSPESPMEIQNFSIEIPLPERELSKVSVVDIPLGPIPGYVKTRVDTARMSRIQRTALARLTTGLQHAEAKLRDGSPIKGASHAIRWLLEKLSDEPKPSEKPIKS